MQRRQFHRNARPPRQSCIACPLADGVNCIRIRQEIALRVRGGAGALAQHVEGIEKRATTIGARQRLFDRLAEHEMRAEQPHGLAGSGAHRRQAEPFDQRLDDAFRRLARMNDARRNAERPGRGRDQQRGRARIVMRPVAGFQLVLDQAVGGVGVGHPQQRLGQHHQRQAFLGGERISVQEILDSAEPADARADRLNQPRGALIDARLGVVRTAGARQ
jgi:hypothetical protein